MTPFLIDDLKAQEGLRLTAYPDPLSGGAPWTIGYGHTGGIVPGETWTLEKAQSTLADDVVQVAARLDSAIPWWREISDVRQDVLADMAFNMGVAGLLGFTHMLQCVKAGDYRNASAAMLLSRWADEVPTRAARLAQMMRTGARP